MRQVAIVNLVTKIYRTRFQKNFLCVSIQKIPQTEIICSIYIFHTQLIDFGARHTVWRRCFPTEPPPFHYEPYIQRDKVEKISCDSHRVIVSFTIRFLLVSLFLYFGYYVRIFIHCCMPYRILWHTISLSNLSIVKLALILVLLVFCTQKHL